MNLDRLRTFQAVILAALSIFIAPVRPALAQEGDPEDKLGALLGALKHPERDVRREVAELLAKHADKVGKRAVQPLIDALGDKDRVVRAQCAKALSRMGSQAVVAVPEPCAA